MIDEPERNEYIADRLEQLEQGVIQAITERIGETGVHRRQGVSVNPEQGGTKRERSKIEHRHTPSFSARKQQAGNPSDMEVVSLDDDLSAADDTTPLVLKHARRRKNIDNLHTPSFSARQQKLENASDIEVMILDGELSDTEDTFPLGQKDALPTTPEVREESTNIRTTSTAENAGGIQR